MVTEYANLIALGQGKERLERVVATPAKGLTIRWVIPATSACQELSVQR